MSNTATALYALILLIQLALLAFTAYIGLFVMDAKTFLVILGMNIITAMLGEIRKWVSS